MRVHFDISDLKDTKWYELAVRFLFGGAITAITGMLANRYGPVFGGLFLAFPALFPASATLLEKHEREKKTKAGIANTSRGREAAALDARGAAIGSIGLVGFALIAWKLLPISNGAIALFAALVAWAVISVLIWLYAGTVFFSAKATPARHRTRLFRQRVTNLYGELLFVRLRFDAMLLLDLLRRESDISYPDACGS